MGKKLVSLLTEHPVILSVLRAGLPMHQGVLEVFDQSDSGFISAFRKHTDAVSFEIESKYLATPDLQNKTVILSDPMLATGKSMHTAYLALLKHGKPGALHLCSIIGSKQGVAYIEKHIPDATLWIAAIDEQLDEHQYIVPGLGDAGDLSFGEKR